MQQENETQEKNSLYRDISYRVGKAFLMLLIAGGLIGLLHPYDALVAGILALNMILITWSMYRKSPSTSRAAILIGGSLLTGVLGVKVELWGIQNGYWEYHDLSNGRHFAYWLPFAWMLAFLFLYRVEEYFIRRLALTCLKKKLLLAAIVSAVLPTWGEIVAINLGVWTYSWDYQLLGVPLLAILLLSLFHTAIFLFLTVTVRKLQVEDIVFGIRPLETSTASS